MTKLIVDYLAALITLYLGLICSAIFFNTKIRFKIINIFIILFTAFAMVFYSYYGDNLTRPFSNLVVLFVCSLLIYKENTYSSLLYALICNVLIGFYEMILSLFLIVFNVINLEAYDNNYLLKAIFSLIIMLLVLFTVKRKTVLNLSNKIVNNKKLTKFIVLPLLIFSLILMVLEFNNTQVFIYKEYMGTLIMILCILFILLVIIRDHIQVQREIDKSNVLLNFMEKYEKIVDENRENNHELLNNLLVLKSIKNKNTLEYNNLLDDLINSFNHKGTNYKNIYNLPSGVKGIIYYKLNSLDETKYNININVSKNVKDRLKKIDHNNYIKLCKILAIILDNAIDACKKTKDKSILIDIYKEDDIIIDVINSFKGKIDINSINEKNYSTKGKHRGYGLYIMKKILNDTDKISVIQSVENNLFNSKIIIKEK